MLLLLLSYCRRTWTTGGEGGTLYRGWDSDILGMEFPKGNEMFKELDCIVLTTDIEKDGLKAGDGGTIVHMYPGGDAFMVEFMMGDVYTVILADVLPSQARIATNEDFTHTRSVDMAV